MSQRLATMPRPLIIRVVLTKLSHPTSPMEPVGGNGRGLRQKEVHLLVTMPVRLSKGKNYQYGTNRKFRFCAVPCGGSEPPSRRPL
jgi:hypothetical protein